ncbi:MAG: hypothetical protein PGN11_14510 [Quadrisphaera sp.]
MLVRWRRQPRWLRGVVAALVLLLLYGTAVHLVQLVAAGGAPYPGLPWWLRAYFVSLTVLDPLAALLLLRRCRTGVVLVVLVTDALANGVANYAYDLSEGVTTGRVGQAVITLLALGSLVVAPALWRAAARREPVR